MSDPWDDHAYDWQAEHYRRKSLTTLDDLRLETTRIAHEYSIHGLNLLRYLHAYRFVTNGFALAWMHRCVLRRNVRFYSSPTILEIAHASNQIRIHPYHWIARFPTYGHSMTHDIDPQEFLDELRFRLLDGAPQLARFDTFRPALLSADPVFADMLLVSELLRRPITNWMPSIGMPVGMPEVKKDSAWKSD